MADKVPFSGIWTTFDALIIEIWCTNQSGGALNPILTLFVDRLVTAI